jgi:hypothetical protein
MPVLIAPLTPEGAIVDVVVGPSAATVQALRTALRPVPAAVKTRAILDTGAEITCIDDALVQALALPFGGTSLAHLPAHGGLMGTNLRDISLTVVHPSGNYQNDLVLRNLTVLELSLAFLGYQLLIGRDLLARCRLLYNGPGNRFRLAY